MTEKTKRIIEIIAAENGISPEKVEHEMMEAIRAGRHPLIPTPRHCGNRCVPMGKSLTWILSRLYGKPRGYDDGRTEAQEK